MVENKEGTFGGFLKFLANLYGMLIGVTLFFPLSNYFINSLTVDNTLLFKESTRGIYLGITTLVSIFNLLSNYNNKDKLKEKGEDFLKKNSYIYLFSGLLSIILFFYLPGALGNFDFIINNDGMRKVVEVLSLILYLGIFISLARSFFFRH